MEERRKYILSHIFVGVQKNSQERIVKADSGYEEIEKYLYIRVKTGENCGWFRKVKPVELELLGITLENAWKQAELNTFSEITIKSAKQLIEEEMGLPTEEIPVYLATNDIWMYGAAAMLDRKRLAEFDREHGNSNHQLVIIPGSVHEIMIIPYDKSVCLEEIQESIREMNKKSVRAGEVLGDSPYILTIK